MDFEKAVWEQLDARRVDDDIIGDAYEAVDAPLRAELKTCIARAHAAFGHITPCLEQKSHVVYAGGEVRCSRRPAHWCLVLLDREENEDSGLVNDTERDSLLTRAKKDLSCSRNALTQEMRIARHAMLAALSAVFAGVCEIWVVIVESRESAERRSLSDRARTVSPLVYAGLELAGIENVCLLPHSALLDMIPCLAGKGPGRLLVMGNPCWKHEVLQYASARNGIAVWCEGAGVDETDICPEALAPGQKDVEWSLLWPILPVSFFQEERIECRDQESENRF